MAFTLPPLPYDYEGLSPVISKETLEFHHDKHHQAYTDNLNKALDGLAEAEGKSLEEIFAEMSKYPKAVRNNGGGYWNHIFYWESMAPAAEAGEQVEVTDLDGRAGGVARRVHCTAPACAPTNAVVGSVVVPLTAGGFGALSAFGLRPGFFGAAAAAGSPSPFSSSGGASPSVPGNGQFSPRWASAGGGASGASG